MIIRYIEYRRKNSEKLNTKTSMANAVNSITNVNIEGNEFDHFTFCSRFTLINFSDL